MSRPVEASPCRALRQLLRRAKRRPIALIAAGIAFVALAFCIAWRLRFSGEAPDLVWERIRRENVLRVCMEASFPPFEFVDQAGEVRGLDVDLSWELARRLGVERMAPVNVHFDGLYDALMSGKCDLIVSALPFDPSLTKDVAYSAPYFNAGQMLLAAENDRSIRGAADLAGKRVAVEMGSEAHFVVRQLLIRKAIPLELITRYTAEEALSLLLTGEADAAVADAATAYAFVGRHSQVRLVGRPLTDEPYVIAMPLGSRVLHSKVDQALDAMTKEGFLDGLRAKWFSAPQP